MARPPLAMGTHGSITVKQRPSGTSWVARCRFRDLDGVTRHLEYAGRTKAAAQAAIQDAIKTRQGTPSAPLRPHHTFERAADLWLAKLEGQVAEGTRAATTADTYRQRLRAVVLPGMGQWRLHECTVPMGDMFFRGLVATQGAESRKTVRTVVSQVLRLAVQHEALRDNPVRHLDPIERGGGMSPPPLGRPEGCHTSGGRRKRNSMLAPTTPGAALLRTPDRRWRQDA